MKSGLESQTIKSTTPHFEGGSSLNKNTSSEFVLFLPPKKHTEVTVSSVAAEEAEPCHQYPPRAFARCGKECKRWPEARAACWIGGHGGLT